MHARQELDPRSTPSGTARSSRPMLIRSIRSSTSTSSEGGPVGPFHSFAGTRLFLSPRSFKSGGDAAFKQPGNHNVPGADRAFGVDDGGVDTVVPGRLDRSRLASAPLNPTRKRADGPQPRSNLLNASRSSCRPGMEITAPSKANQAGSHMSDLLAPVHFDIDRSGPKL